MKRVLVTQRVTVEPHGERRDALDQRWPAFLVACELLPIVVPNVPDAAGALLDQVPFDGVLLTGGNDLTAYGGDAPERDRVEEWLLQLAIDRRLPLLGTCRGMQVLQHAFGVQLQRVDGHVQPKQTIQIDDRWVTVNSYHHWGSREAGSQLEVWARARDGVVKAIRHPQLPVVGIMWHPERSSPWRADDIALFRDHFSVDDGPSRGTEP